MKPSLLLGALVISFFSTSSFAQEVLVEATATPSPVPGAITTNISIINQERYLGNSDTKKTIQANITIKGSVDFNGLIQIHALVQTGNKYNIGFNDIYDIKANDFTDWNTINDIYLKRLYLKKALMDGKLTVSGGAMDTRAAIAQVNAISGAGWIDGVRAELTTAVGNMTMTVGEINTASPSMIERFKTPGLNYFEITLSKKLFNKLLLEGGVEVFEGKTFIEAASKLDIEVAADKIIKLVADAKIQASNGAIKVGIGIQDVLSLFSKKISMVKLSVGYEYVSEGFDPGMNKLANTMHTGYTGSVMNASVQFPISKKFGLSGVTSVRVGGEKSDFRVEAGIVKNIFVRTYKKPIKKPYVH